MVADKIFQEGQPHELVGVGDVEDAGFEAHAGSQGCAPCRQHVLWEVEAVDAAAEVLQKGDDQPIRKNMPHGDLHTVLVFPVSAES